MRTDVKSLVNHTCEGAPCKAQATYACDRPGELLHIGFTSVSLVSGRTIWLLVAADDYSHEGVAAVSGSPRERAIAQCWNKVRFDLPYKIERVAVYLATERAALHRTCKRSPSFQSPNSVVASFHQSVCKLLENLSSRNMKVVSIELDKHVDLYNKTPQLALAGLTPTAVREIHFNRVRPAAEGRASWLSITDKA